MRFVLDASVTLAWCFEDEEARTAEAALDLLKDGEALVPSLWSLEVANALVVAERRGRLVATDASRFVSVLARLPIRLDPETAEHALTDTMGLAREHGLSAYDAAYLEAALRHGMPLATLDDALVAAARAAGVRLVIAPEVAEIGGGKGTSGNHAT